MGKGLYNMVNTHNFFSMYRLIRKRVKRIGMDIEDIPENMEVRTKYNEYGDYTGHYNLSSARHWDSAPLPMVSPDEKVFIDLKEKISILSERGVTIFFLPPPYCRSSFQNDSLAINRISESLKAIGFPYYLEPSGCVYPDSMFYDSRYHLIREGVVMHSRKIAGELKRTL